MLPTLDTPTPTARGKLRRTPPCSTPPVLSATHTLSEPTPSPMPELPTPSPTLPSAPPTPQTLESAPTSVEPLCHAAGRGRLMPTPPSSTLALCPTPTESSPTPASTAPTPSTPSPTPPPDRPTPPTWESAPTTSVPSSLADFPTQTAHQ